MTDKAAGHRLQALLVTAVLLVAGCSGSSPTPVPTPVIVYVTAPPAPSVPEPTPIVVYVTPAPSSAAAGHLLTGTLALNQTQFDWDVHLESAKPVYGCEGKGGYSDIMAGAGVVVRDGQSVVIGTATLAPPAFKPGSPCAFSFTLTVPDEAFYSVEVGHRGAITYSNADLAAKGWHVDLTLGG